MEYNKILFKDVSMFSTDLELSDDYVEGLNKPDECFDDIFSELMESAVFLKEDSEKGYKLSLIFSDIEFDTSTLFFSVICEYPEEDLKFSHTYALSLISNLPQSKIVNFERKYEGVIIQLEKCSFDKDFDFFMRCFEPVFTYGLGFVFYFFHKYDGKLEAVLDRNPLFEHLFRLKHQYDNLVAKTKDFDRSVLKAKEQLQKLRRRHEKEIKELRKGFVQEISRKDVQNKEFAEKLRTLKEDNIKALNDLKTYRKQERENVKAQQDARDLDKKFIELEDEIKNLRKQLADKDSEFDRQVGIIEKLRASKEKQERKLKSLQEYLEFLEFQFEEMAENNERVVISDVKEFAQPLEKTDSFFRKLKGLKVLVIGGHVNWQNKLKEIYPEFSYIASDNVNFSVGMLKTADLVFFNILHCSHTLYYKVKENINWGRDKSEYKDRLVYVNSNSLEDFTLCLKEKLM